VAERDDHRAARAIRPGVAHYTTLPREHAAWLVDDAGPDNLARTITYLPMLAEG
jgi:hypothetical protein